MGVRLGESGPQLTWGNTQLLEFLKAVQIIRNFLLPQLFKKK